MIQSDFNWALPDLVLANNLFRGGTLYLDDWGDTWTLKDNLFDQTTIVISEATDAYLVDGYNGYVTNCNRLNNTFGTDKILTNSPGVSDRGAGAMVLSDEHGFDQCGESDG